MEVKRICQWCGKPFIAQKTTTCYCTGSDRADFGSPHRVEKVVYTPRNEVNFIYKGNLYELFYWGGGKWNSVGRQMAVSDSIVYSGFQGALFYLKNHTAGKDERIFEYKDGKQIFW